MNDLEVWQYSPKRNKLQRLPNQRQISAVMATGGYQKLQAPEILSRKDNEPIAFCGWKRKDLYFFFKIGEFTSVQRREYIENRLSRLKK